MAFSALCIVFFLWNQLCFAVSLNIEGLAILSFKESLTKSPEEFFSSWNSSDDTPCSWHGVTCKDWNVISLVIPNQKLSGTLSADLGKLSMLSHFNIRDNELFGVLPFGFFRAKELRSLILAGNSFSGQIPPEIGNLRHLATLDLSRNSFNGSIPKNLDQCRRLKLLYLNENSFSDPLPIGKSLTSLKRLNLSSNKLTGFIPSELGDLSNLKGVLDLSHNFFSGEIPASLGNIPATVYVDLSYNNLSGKIPQVDTLLDGGPTAFLGNPFLCGSPLNSPCSEKSTPDGISVKRGIKRCRLAVLITAVVGVLAGAFVIAIFVSLSCKRIKACNFEDASMGKRRENFCSKKHVLETMSESVENYTFVRLDQSVDFDVDRLLTASAFFLGKSGAGIVYRVELQNGVSLAVRRLCEEGGVQSLKEFRADVEAIGKIKHPNIVALRAYCWSAEEKLLVSDYVVNGDLATAIHGQPGTVSPTSLSWPVRLTIINRIARGLTHLHEHSPRKYVHGNLKPTNILLGPDMDPQIADLGLHRLAKTAQQTAPYTAPEASGPKKPSQKWDVFSFGAIVLEMIAGKSPEMGIVRWFRLCIDEGKPFSDVVDPVLTGDVDLQDEVISVMRIGLACVHTSPEKRPSMKSVSDALARLG